MNAGSDASGYAARMAIGEAFRKSQAAGDADGIRKLLADDVVWVLPGDNAVSGEARGAAGVFDRFAALARFGVSISIEHVTVGRDGVAIILHNTGAAEGRVLDEHLVSTLTLRDGKITRIDTYLSDIDMMNQYFADEPGPR